MDSSFPTAARDSEQAVTKKLGAARWLLAGATIFSGAFLLFEVEPLIARAILPWFGGSAQVWTTCLLFFQTALLLGYLYAHLLSEHVRAEFRLRVHFSLLVLSLLFLPIIPSVRLKPVGSEDPFFLILGLLAATIGLPFVLLSATNPLVQSWLARHEHASGGGRAPYSLFALSNLGSMLALISYPLLVEPALSLKTQAYSWSVGYGVFVCLCAAAAWTYRVSGEARVILDHEDRIDAPPLTERALVFLLAAAPSALLLAVTNFMLQNIAAIPLFWIVPLALYLMSFIIAFGSSRWYWRLLWYEFFFGAIGSMIVGMIGYSTLNNVRYLISLFVVCLVCHAELASIRPKPRYLTSYYLTISAGGAVGGVLVAAVAPAIFNAAYELAILAPLTGLIVILAAWRHYRSATPSRIKNAIFAVACVALLVGTFFSARFTYEDLSGHVFLARNFYGSLRVTDFDADEETPARRILQNGTIDHGEEFSAPERRLEPLTYFSHESGVGLLIDELGKDGALKVGVVGLGAGTLAAYCRPGDSYRFYEINPLVIEIARRDFGYLSSCPNAPALILGDARLSLEKELSQQFDVLAVDAFVSDAIPVHLLTRETMELYWRHLKPDGVLAVHISNSYVDLGPIVGETAAASGRTARFIYRDADPKNAIRTSSWVLITSRASLFDRPALQYARPVEVPKGFRGWTDDYSNLWSVFRF